MAEKNTPLTLPTAYTESHPPSPRATWPKTIIKSALLGAILLYLASSANSTPLISSQELLGRAQDVLSLGGKHENKAFVSVECEGDLKGKEGFDCGYFEVPLDYLNNTDTRLAHIAFSRYSPPIPTSSKLGTVFVSPGGPGGSGYDMIARAGPSLSLLQGGKYDIIGFDPRGIGRTRPKFSCFEDATKESISGLMNRDRLTMGLYPKGNLTDEAELRELRKQLTMEHALDKALAASCMDPEGAGSYMSTAHVVRDIERMSSLLTGPSTPINFQGFSYGTTVGTYLISMFPQRVGRVVIDGVMHVPSWFGEAHYKMGGEYYFSGMEMAWEAFLGECAKAGPGRCALAEEGLDGPAIGKKVDDLLEGLYQEPLSVPNAKYASILTPANIRGRMFRGLYKPREFQAFAKDLQDAIDGNGAPILDSQMIEIELNKTKPATGAAAAGAIVGYTDAPPSTVKDQDKVPLLLEQMIEEQQTYSKHFTGIMPMLEEGWNWNFTASERFAGPVASELSYPMLIIGNTYDNICPLANAFTMHSLIKDSRLIHQDTPGHCSSALTSLCTIKIMQDYFNNGTLPREDVTFCERDEELFPVPKGEASQELGVLGVDHPLKVAGMKVAEAQAEAMIW